MGAGLLGGSVALASRSADMADRIFAVCRSRNRCLDLQSIHLVDQAFLSWKDAILQLQKEANSNNRPILILVGTPVGVVVEQVQAALKAIEEVGDSSRFYLITDVGSTKEYIVTTLKSVSFPENTIFIGSHPIAGSEKTGPENANGDLFLDKTTVLTPVELDENNSALTLLQQFWQRIGSRTIILDPKEHDRILARTSHLPHLLSGILAILVERKEYDLSGTGYADMTRLAAGSPEVWVDIFGTNSNSVLAAIADFEFILAKWKAALVESENVDQRKTLLEEAKKKRDALGS